MVPKMINDWTITSVIDLLRKGYYESEEFDFKEMLPSKHDEKGKFRLSRTCCAFANSSGGFLVFGIKNDNALSLHDRLIGVESSLDFPEHFGVYPKKCTPSVDWTFKNPPIALENGRLIHVIHIPKSWNSPHCIGHPENGFFFMKRTNKGDEAMSLEEVRLHFLGFYEKSVKLQLLKAEVESIKQIATNMILSEEDLETKYSIAKFSLNILESVLSDVYTIIANESDLLTALLKLRTLCRVLNNKISLFHNRASFPPTNINEIMKNHNQQMNSQLPYVIECAEGICKALDAFLEKSIA
jgi:hypothetical protein